MSWMLTVGVLGAVSVAITLQLSELTHLFSTMNLEVDQTIRAFTKNLEAAAALAAKPDLDEQSATNRPNQEEK